MAGEFRITEVAAGMMRVEHDGRLETVYVAGPPTDRWAFWKGTVFRADLTPRQAPSRGRRGAHAAQPLSAPMPATVIQVLVRAGDAVRKGDTVVLLEAMKMELPIRAPADGVVTAVYCSPRDLVQADAVLLEIT